MKRGSFVGKRHPMNKVSAKVKAERPEFDAVYRDVDERSGGRCEIVLPWAVGMTSRGEMLSHFETRCPARAVEHHHLRKPRRSPENHRPEFIIHICRRHHDMCTASFRVGRLEIDPLAAETFPCRIEQKASKFA